jgi:hypothetical protein
MKKYLLTLTLTFSLLLFCTPSLFAQPGFDDDVEDAPIDGGIALLVVSGIGYGIKKIQVSKKQKM